MAASSYSTSVPSLPPPSPKSPPQSPDLFGKRRELAKVKMLERDISSLEICYHYPHALQSLKILHISHSATSMSQCTKLAHGKEELKSLEGLQLSSRCCKEVDSFIVAKPDPFIPINRKIHRSHRLWKWLCRKSCFNLSWICCTCRCSLHFKRPKCCKSEKKCCASCPSVNWRCCCWPSCHCLGKMPSIRCCIFSAPSCPDCPSCRCTCSFPKCNKVRRCSNCTKTCCNPCYLCY